MIAPLRGPRPVSTTSVAWLPTMMPTLGTAPALKSGNAHTCSANLMVAFSRTRGGAGCWADMAPRPPSERPRNRLNRPRNRQKEALLLILRFYRPLSIESTRCDGYLDARAGSRAYGPGLLISCLVGAGA